MDRNRRTVADMLAMKGRRQIKMLFVAQRTGRRRRPRPASAFMDEIERAR